MEFLLYAAAAVIVLFLSYRTNLKRSILLSAGISVLLFAAQVRTIPRHGLFIFLFFINSIPLVTEGFKRNFERRRQSMKGGFNEAKKDYEELVRTDKQEIESNLKKEKKLQQVLSLYEISKDMSTCLAFDDIFSIFSATLKKSFRFRVSRLAILKDTGEIDSVYRVEIGRGVHKAEPEDFDRLLVGIALETKKSLQLSQEEQSQLLRKLCIVKEFDSLVSIPLFVEGRIAGLLYIENLSRGHFENFMILAGQFAIQFQKVILYKKVQDMSITDSLTEISNRRYFLERLDEELRRSMRHKSNLALLMLDLDHFKEKNDKFGHLVGDVVLKEVAAMLKSSLREIDIIGRYGGEEFAIVLTGIGRGGAQQVAERIRQNIEAAVFKAYDEIVSTTVSIGISVFPDDGVDVHSLIESADKALYKAKETGRNRIC